MTTTAPAPPSRPRSDYAVALGRVLYRATPDVTRRLRTMVRDLPATATELAIDVFPGQYDDGNFDVWARVEGPDAYALTRPFDDIRALFGVEFTETGFEPPVPDPRGQADVADQIVDTVAEWLAEVWADVSEGVPVPCRIEGEHGTGAITPLLLQPGTALAD